MERAREGPGPGGHRGGGGAAPPRAGADVLERRAEAGVGPDRARRGHGATDRSPGGTEPSVTVEVFADIWCPYAHVGLRRFLQRRWAAGRHDLILRVRGWPLELVNREPLDGDHVAEQIEE